jgi:hypothetical protein
MTCDIFAAFQSFDSISQALIVTHTHTICTHTHNMYTHNMYTHTYIYIYVSLLRMYQNERVCTALVQVSFDMFNLITEVPPSQEAFQDASARGGPCDARAAQLQHAGDSHRHGAETSDPEPPRVVGPSQRLRHLEKWIMGMAC